MRVRDPGSGMEKNSDLGSGIQDGKNLDPGSGMEKIRIRDPGFGMCRLHTAILDRPSSSAATMEVQGPDTK